mgnify:CR=1 FL=1
MTMTDTPTAPLKKAPARKRAKRKAKPPGAPKKPSLMAGITVRDCPSACSEKGCVISGTPICAHPHKGGLQASLQTPDSMRRLNEAKQVLGKAKLALSET